MRMANLCWVALVSIALLFSGCSKKENRAVAKVGKQTITVADLEKRLGNRKFSSPEDELEQKRQTVQNLVDEALMTIGATEAGLDKDPTFLAKMEEARRNILLQELFNVEILKKSEPSEKELKEYYDKLSWEVKASHIVVKTEREAEEILKQLAEGADFAELAKEKSIDPRTKTKGGDLGYFGWGRMVSPFQDTAWAMKPGTISKPVQTKFGWHIIKLEDRRRSKLKSYDEEKKGLRGRMINQKSRELSQEYVASLQEKANIQLDPNAVQVVLNKFLAKKQAPEDFTEEEKKMTLVTFRGGSWTIEDFLAEQSKVPSMYRPRLKNPDDLRNFVTNTLTGNLLEAVAKKKGLDRKKEVVEKIRNQENNLLVKLFLQKGVPRDTTVTEEQIQAYYQEHIDKYSEPEKVRVWEIQLQTKKEAEEILKQLQAGANFEKLAREKSIRLWAAKEGGDLGYVDKPHYPNIAEAALQLKPGQLGGPIKDEDSYKYSIIKVGDKKPSQPKPLEDLRDHIKGAILRERQDEAGKQWLEKMRQKYGVEIFTDVIESTVTTQKKEAA